MITEAGQFEDAEDSSIASEEEFGPPILTIQGVASARLKVYDEKDLQITLLHRRVPPDMRSSSFIWVAGRLLANGERIHRPIKKDGKLIPPDERDQPLYRTSSLYEQLNRVGLEFDITPAEQTALPVLIESFAPSNDSSIDEQGTELALVPSPSEAVTAMLIKQSRMCFRGLASWSKKAAYPTSQSPLHIPFARMPADASFEEQRNFTKVINDLLPLHVIMGEIDTDIHDRTLERTRDVR